MYDSILAPTDGSDVAEAAGEFACELARTFDAELHVVSVAEPLGIIEGDRSTEDEDKAVETIADLATSMDVSVTSSVLETDQTVHERIVGYAETQEIDLIVMGTRGRSGVRRFLLGSVAEQTLRESSVPVATVQGEISEPSVERVLVATDGSESALAAADNAIGLALETDARIQIVHVTDDGLEESTTTVDVSNDVGIPAVDDVLERAREAELETVDVSTPGGRTDQAILSVAAERNADCIVLGTGDRSGVRRYLLGSTAERVVRFTTAPVFTVAPPRGPTATVEYLDYAVLEERSWTADDPDLFEKAANESLDSDAYGSFEMDQSEYLLDAAESEGYDWPVYCRAGGCVNCVVKLIEGEIEMDVQRSLSEAELEEDDLRLSCVGSPTTESVKLLYNAKRMDQLQDRVM